MEWEIQFQKKLEAIDYSKDPAHDLAHFKRVVKTAKQLCAEEKGKLEVVVPAAWLHDFVVIPKNDSRQAMASQLSAKAAIEFLQELQFPEQFYNEIGHAIEAHSFSSGIQPKTLEAKIVQDADRLDGLGAIGIARCFSTTGSMAESTTGSIKRCFYSEMDPFCESRSPDDNLYTIDHFYKKLFKVAHSLQTQAGKQEGMLRVEFMKTYLKRLNLEIS